MPNSFAAIFCFSNQDKLKEFDRGSMNLLAKLDQILQVVSFLNPFFIPRQPEFLKDKKYLKKFQEDIDRLLAVKLHHNWPSYFLEDFRSRKLMHQWRHNRQLDMTQDRLAFMCS